MRILTLSNCPLVESQGTGYVIMGFARGLRARGHYVDLFGPDVYELFPFFQKASAHRKTLGMAIFAARRLRKLEYDVVEFYGAESWLAVLLLRRWRRRKFLMVSHSNGIEPHCTDALLRYGGAATWNGEPRKWYQKVLRPPVESAFTAVEGLVTVSGYDRDYALAKRYQDPVHAVALNNSLPDNYLGQDVSFTRKPVIGFCGSWVSRKGTQVMKADLARVLHEFPDCQLKLVGVGPAFARESHFPANVCSRIVVVPHVEDKRELQRIYASMSILVLPSFYESFGLVAAEAMACGCALVAARTGFAAALRDEEEALLLPEPKSPFLYETVTRLLADDELRGRIARAGYLRVQGLRWEEAVQALEQTYLGWLRQFRQGFASQEAAST